MATFGNQPDNKNIANTTNYRLVIPRAPTVTFFCQRLKIPDISGAGAEQPNMHAMIFHPGDHIVFDDLPLSFLLDEDFANWQEIFNWMEDYGMIEHATPRDVPDDRLVCDIEVIVTANNKQPVQRFIFYNAFPIYLQGMDFDSTVQDATPISLNTVFRYTYYRMLPLNGISPCPPTTP